MLHDGSYLSPKSFGKSCNFPSMSTGAPERCHIHHHWQRLPDPSFNLFISFFIKPRNPLRSNRYTRCIIFHICPFTVHLQKTKRNLNLFPWMKNTNHIPVSTCAYLPSVVNRFYMNWPRWIWKHFKDIVFPVFSEDISALNNCCTCHFFSMLG